MPCPCCALRDRGQIRVRTHVQGPSVRQQSCYGMNRIFQSRVQVALSSITLGARREIDDDAMRSNALGHELVGQYSLRMGQRIT